MYTGIIRGAYPVTEIEDKPGLRSILVAIPQELQSGLTPGASVSVDGVCLTVVSMGEAGVRFDLMAETLARTTLGKLVRGAAVNIERSAIMGEEIGGHPLSGHVDFVATVVSVERPQNNCVLTLRVKPEYAKYLFEKGYVAVHGASLTIAQLNRADLTFVCYLIPETLARTNLASKQVGDELNIEIDRSTQIIVDTVTALVKSGEFSLPIAV